MKESNDLVLAAHLAECQALVGRLYDRAQASRWQLPLPVFREALIRSAKKHFGAAVPSAPQLEEYLSSLHAEDLALACACGEGIDAAWEHFVGAYQSYLRVAAGAILRCPAESADARDLADALFADLYGWKRAKPERESLFRYFHGRSKLSTWLRAVLAQRHVDQIRAARRLEPLDSTAEGSRAAPARGTSSPLLLDPARPRYVALFRRALEASLAKLPLRDRERLTLYYVEEQTLAETGRRLREHESSVSRNLERVRRELRSAVENLLRAGIPPIDGQAAGPGLDDAQMALCFQYAVEDAPIDLDKALRPSPGPLAQRKES